MKPRVLIIIPAYNEEESLGAVIDRILAETPYRDILVLNDGSTDSTARVAAARGAIVLNLPWNVGIGAAVQTGYRFAARRGYDYTVRVDGDGQHEVSQIPDLLVPLAAGEADLVIGSRVLGDGSFRSSLARAAGIRILAAIVSRLTGRTITDPTSGFLAANRAVAALFARSYPDDYPEVESIVMLSRKGFRVREVGVRMAVRSAGRSSITAAASIYYMVKVILAILIEMLREGES
ncbi:MAG: glycosyltransferase family 2 protein [Chlamydiota bacterium]